jgi:hypothetical protein
MKVSDRVEMDLSVHEALMVMSGLQHAMHFYSKRDSQPYPAETIEEIRILNRKVKVFIFGENAVTNAEQQAGGNQ